MKSTSPKHFSIWDEKSQTRIRKLNNFRLYYRWQKIRNTRNINVMYIYIQCEKARLLCHHPHSPLVCFSLLHSLLRNNKMSLTKWKTAFWKIPSVPKVSAENPSVHFYTLGPFRGILQTKFKWIWALRVEANFVTNTEKSVDILCCALLSICFHTTQETEFQK